MPSSLCPSLWEDSCFLRHTIKLRWTKYNEILWKPLKLWFRIMKFSSVANLIQLSHINDHLGWLTTLETNTSSPSNDERPSNEFSDMLFISFFHFFCYHIARIEMRSSLSNCFVSPRRDVNKINFSCLFCNRFMVRKLFWYLNERKILNLSTVKTKSIMFYVFTSLIQRLIR